MFEIRNKYVPNKFKTSHNSQLKSGLEYKRSIMIHLQTVDNRVSKL